MSSTKLTAGPRIDTATVLGWAVDADPKNDPTYPYRDRAAYQSKGMDCHR